MTIDVFANRIVHVTRVLFVCTGNICRSPTAEAVARSMAYDRDLQDQVEFDSAGLEGYHVGDPPDHRAIEHGQQRGYDLSHLRARRVRTDDFTAFDLILAMDHGHYRALLRQCPPPLRSKVRMFLSGATECDVADVPDPYYGRDRDFEIVLDLCEAAMPKWLDLAAGRPT